MLLVRMCYLADLPNLAQIISNNTVQSNIKITSEIKIGDENKTVSPDAKLNQDLVGEVMRNFSGAKIIDN